MKLYRAISRTLIIITVEAEIRQDGRIYLNANGAKREISMRNPEGYPQYFYTLEQAQLYLLSIARRDVAEKQGALDYAKEWLEMLEESINKTK